MVETARPGIQFASGSILLPQRHPVASRNAPKVSCGSSTTIGIPETLYFRPINFRQLTPGRARCKPVHGIEHSQRRFVVVTLRLVGRRTPKRIGANHEKLVPFLTLFIHTYAVSDSAC